MRERERGEGEREGVKPMQNFFMLLPNFGRSAHLAVPVCKRFYDRTVTVGQHVDANSMRLTVFIFSKIIYLPFFFNVFNIFNVQKPRWRTDKSKFHLFLLQSIPKKLVLYQNITYLTFYQLELRLPILNSEVS